MPHCGHEGPLLSASPSHGGTEMLPWGTGLLGAPSSLLDPSQRLFPHQAHLDLSLLPFGTDQRLETGWAWETQVHTHSFLDSLGREVKPLSTAAALGQQGGTPKPHTRAHGPLGPRDTAVQVCKAQVLLATPCGHPSQEQQGGGAAVCAPAPRVPSATSTSGRWPGPPLSSASQMWSPHQQHQYCPGLAQTRHEGQTMGGPPSLSERPHDAVTEALLR